MDFNYVCRHYGWIVEVMGLVSWLYLIKRGFLWLLARMPEDLGAFGLLDTFEVMYRSTATPLETQKEETNDAS